MAKPKKGALHQLLVPMVDATDFASIESAITESDFNSGVTKKWYGWDTGGSAATTSGTISKTGSLVRSGVFRITLKATENNYDNVMIRLSKTGCAEQIMAWSNVDSDESDFMSAMTVIQSMASDAASAAQQANSRVLLNQSRISDVYSLLSDFQSDFGSRIPKEPAARSQLSDLASDLRSYLVGMSGMVSDIQSALSDAHSDLGSKIGGITASVSASDISDIASAVRATLVSDLSDILSAAQQTNSRVLLNQSRISDIASVLSDFESNFSSRVPKLVATSSQLSDLASDVKSAVQAITLTLTASDLSDIASAVVAALPITSTISDIYSLLSDLNSNFLSRIPKEPAARSQLSDLASDIRSVVSATELDASDLSDIASAVWAARYTPAWNTPSTFASMIYNIHSHTQATQSMASDAASAAQQANSRVLLNQSRISDVYSLLSDLDSNFGSRVPKAVATNSQLSDLASDLKSYLAGVSGMVSDLQSALAAGVSLSASDMSDLRSAIAATELDASDLSDIASAVWARVGAEPAANAVPAVAGSMGAKVDWLFVMSRNKLTQTATVLSLRNDADNDNIASAAVSDDGTTYTRGEFA